MIFAIAAFALSVAIGVTYCRRNGYNWENTLTFGLVGGAIVGTFVAFFLLLVTTS